MEMGSQPLPCTVDVIRFLEGARWVASCVEDVSGRRGEKKIMYGKARILRNDGQLGINCSAHIRGSVEINRGCGHRATTDTMANTIEIAWLMTWIACMVR